MGFSMGFSMIDPSAQLGSIPWESPIGCGRRRCRWTPWTLTPSASLLSLRSLRTTRPYPAGRCRWHNSAPRPWRRREIWGVPWAKMRTFHMSSFKTSKNGFMQVVSICSLGPERGPEVAGKETWEFRGKSRRIFVAHDFPWFKLIAKNRDSTYFTDLARIQPSNNSRILKSQIYPITPTEKWIGVSGFGPHLQKSWSWSTPRPFVNKLNDLKVSFFSAR